MTSIYEFSGDLDELEEQEKKEKIKEKEPSKKKARSRDSSKKSRAGDLEENKDEQEELDDYAEYVSSLIKEKEPEPEPEIEEESQSEYSAESDFEKYSVATEAKEQSFVVKSTKTQATAAGGSAEIKKDASSFNMKYLYLLGVLFFGGGIAASFYTANDDSEASILSHKNKKQNHSRSTSSFQKNLILKVPGINPIINLNAVCLKHIQKTASKPKEIMQSTNLCNEIDSGTKLIKPEVKILLALQNPIYRTVRSFYEMRDPKSSFYNEVLVGMSFSEYLNSSYMEQNYLTRALTCTPSNAKLHEVELKRAKHALKYKSYVSLPSEKKQNETVKALLSEALGARYNRQCTFLNTKSNQMGIHEELEAHDLTTKYFHALTKANAFDIDLYDYVLSLKKKKFV